MSFLRRAPRPGFSTLLFVLALLSIYLYLAGGYSTKLIIVLFGAWIFCLVHFRSALLEALLATTLLSILAGFLSRALSTPLFVACLALSLAVYAAFALRDTHPQSL